MNEVQEKIAALQEKGWTLAAIADGLEVGRNTVEKWKAGNRNPVHLRQVLSDMDRLLRRKRIPKKRRYKRQTGERHS